MRFTYIEVGHSKLVFSKVVGVQPRLIVSPNSSNLVIETVKL